MTTPSLEARVAHVEGIVGQVDTRLARMETRLDDSVSELRGGITSLRQEGRQNFQWTLGLLVGMWVTIILAILIR
jgi:hypothetical protein